MLKLVSSQAAGHVCSSSPAERGIAKLREAEEGSHGNCTQEGQ